MPPGCLGLDDVDIVPGRGVTGVTRQLMEGCIRRTFTSHTQVTQLIRQRANPRATGSLRGYLRVRDFYTPCWRYSCLAYAIDSPTKRPFLYASGAGNQKVPVLLPQWSSRQLQRDVINTLVDGGADVNAAAGGEERPIQMAIAAGNQTAVDALLERQANVRGFRVMEFPHVSDYAPSVTREYEAALMSVYRRLIQHDSTVAAERFGGDSLVHLAAIAPSIFSQQFIDQYLDLITSHGADMTATDPIGWTPLHIAAFHGSPCVARWLCRQLTADDVNRGRSNQANLTPLAEAAEELDQQQQGEEQHGEELGEGRSRHIRNYKATIATEEERRHRQLVLAEYATVLSELSEAVMSAINSALAPQRDHSMLLARLLPLAPHHDGAHPHASPSNMAFGPHEAEAIGWKIGAFLHEPPAAVAAIDQYLIGESVLRSRVRAAVAHFVKSAATQTSSNREVVGGTRHEQQGDKRVKVTVPPLQCFAVRGSGGQVKLMGVREVVHRARLDEATTHGVAGVVKGFNEHLGDQDCQFSWQQLGRIDRGIGLFVPLGIN
ncbi:unnamed protein product [Vitrella brassicaformis CCMP3155]|uniref:Uncharacterized protein n=1 Tax=Vitrella brassicaformis (strain CCMP3155) TaxID=1169540 RepID=A0A0G4EEN8_VITBC|nr:unnamed protein product [Vitrella brassicaformis CCMP3155]|eukprot:CEL94471.1 unnamed protein product [Vitrella brassicaformis CCMP3155]